MKQIIFILCLLPTLLFAQYPNSGNKSRLGYQTTGDGLIWRGVAADTAIKPRTTANAYFQLDTVNRILRRYIATQGSWQVVGGGSASIDSLVYSTIKGLNDSIQAEKQTLSFASPLLGISDGNNVDLSPLLTGYVTGSGTNNRISKWSALTNLTDSNVQDDGTAVSILSSKPFQLGQWTTAGRPSGTTGYEGYNTTGNGKEWYQGSRWAYVLESTFARGTDKRFAVFDANGQVINSHVQLRGTNAAFSVYIGNLAGNTATGTYNTALGEEALKVASGTSNTAIGAYALFSNVGGVDNVALGVNTLYSNTGGGRNIAIGRNSQLTATGSSGNVSMGYEALRNNTGSNNFALGNDALRVNTANLNFALGNSALNVNSSGTENTAIGASSMITNTIGSYNAGIGGSSLGLNLSGNYNVGIGIRSIYSNSTGQYNIGIGTDAMYNTTGSFNVGIGPNVGYRSTSGSNNVFIGYNAFYSTVSNGVYSNNIAIGYEVARNVATGADNNIIIGNSISLPTAGGDNQLNIGNAIFGTGLTGTGTTVAGKIGILKPVPDYVFDATSTDAFGFPRGTVAQRPTIVSSTTPMRFNTDSTALEYGESVGTWRLLSTRAYSRSLVSGLSPDTWLGTRLNAGNVDINANAHEFRIDSLSALIVSAESTATLGGAGIEQIKWLNTARTKYFNRRLHYDSRAGISGGMPAYYNLLTINNGSGDGFEWTNEMIRDTTAGVFVYGYGGRYNEGYLKFGSIRSNTAGVYLDVPRFHFYGTSSAENATANTYHTLWGESTSLSSMMMGLKDGGKFLIAADSTMIFDPSLDVPQFNKMGAGNKEAPDVSKTESVYDAVLATDGTLIERQAKIERYATVTSTSSPQTLSNDYSDNLINQGGTQATFTLNFPASPVDGQVLKITYNNAITTLTLDGNGNTIVGSAVTTGVAGSQRAFKFYTGIGWIKLY